VTEHEIRREVIKRLRPYLDGAERAADKCLAGIAIDRTGGVARSLLYHQHTAAFLRKIIGDMERGIPGTYEHEKQKIRRLSRVRLEDIEPKIWE